MINGIGPSTSAPIGTQRGGDAKPADAVALRPGGGSGGSVATTVGRMVAEGAPIELDRVAALCAAIRAGTYKPDAETIAGKMIAADLP